MTQYNGQSLQLTCFDLGVFFCSSSGVNETRLAVATAQRGDCFRIDLTGGFCSGVSEEPACNSVLSDRASFAVATGGFWFSLSSEASSSSNCEDILQKIKYLCI